MIYDIFNQDILEDGDLNAIPMDGYDLNADVYDEELDDIFFDEYSDSSVDEFTKDIHEMIYDIFNQRLLENGDLPLHEEQIAKGDKL